MIHWSRFKIITHNWFSSVKSTILQVLILPSIKGALRPTKMPPRLMLASHCPELDTRWPHEYGILNFARRWPRTWSPANQQPKQLRCLQKVTRWQPNHTRRQHEDVIFYQVTYPQDTRRLHNSYTTSYWEYDAFELGHECVTWSPDGINPL